MSYDLLNLPQPRAKPLPAPKALPRPTSSRAELLPADYRPQPIIASSMALDLGNRLQTETFMRTGQMQQHEQRLLWQAYREQPILRYCIDYGAHTISRVRWAPGYDYGDGEPVERNDSDLVNEIIKDFANGAKSSGSYAGHAALGMRMGQHQLLIGENFIHTSLDVDPITGEPMNRYAVYSTSELVRSGSGYVELMVAPGAPMMPLPIGPGAGQLIRVWRPDPEWSEMSASPIAPVLDLFEQLQNLRDALAAIDKSRMGAGFTVFPSEMDWEEFYPSNAETGEPGGFKSFLRDFMEMQVQPVKDRKSAASVAAVGMQMKGDLIEKIKHFNESRESVEFDVKRLQEITEAILRVLPLPPASLTGKQEINHWGAWLVTYDEYQALSPYVLLSLDPWTRILRQMLLRAGQPDWESWSVIPDPTGILLKPDRSADALQLFDRGAIGYPALRRMTSTPETDKPTPEEIPVMLMFKQNKAQPEAAPASLVTTEQGIPTPPAGVTAAAVPAPPIDTDALAKLGPKLAQIDRDLRTKLETAGDLEVALAIKRIAGRVWSALPESEKRRLADYRGAELVAAVGPDKVRALGIDIEALLAEHLGEYSARATDWISSAWNRIQGLLGKTLGAEPATGSAEIGRALEVLRAGVVTEAQRQLWQPATEPPPQSEWVLTASVRPLVRRVLGIAGGENEDSLDLEEAEMGTPAKAGGLATGGIVLGLIRSLVGAVAGPARLVMNPIYTWSHGDTERPFPAHLDLDGTEFRSFDDPVLVVRPEDTWLGIDHYVPGDHVGCGCSYDLRFELEPA